MSLWLTSWLSLLNRVISFCLSSFFIPDTIPVGGLCSLHEQVIILKYAKTEDVHVQKDSLLLTWRVKKVMCNFFKESLCMHWFDIGNCIQNTSLNISHNLLKYIYKGQFVDFKNSSFPIRNIRQSSIHFLSIFKQKVC